MSLLYAHPFSRMATADLTVGPDPAMSTISSMVVQTSVPPVGTGYGLGFSSGAGYGYRSGLGDQAGMALGFHFRVDTLTGADGTAIAVLSNNSPVYGGGGNIHVSLALNSDGSLRVYRNRPITFTTPSGEGTALGAASTTTNPAFVLAAGNWYYIELVASFSDTVGTVQVWVEGVKWIDLTGVDTVQGATTTANTFALGAAGTTQTYFGNVYVTSLTGGTRQGRLGPQKFTTYVGNGDSVTNADFALSTGSSASALVDDTTPNGDTDYLESTGAGDKVGVTMPTVSASGQITAVQVRAYVEKTDVAALTARVLMRIGGTDYMGTSRSPLTGYGYMAQLYEASPATSADFTGTELSGAEPGIEHES